MEKIQEKRRGRVWGIFPARRGQSGKKEGKGQAGRAGREEAGREVTEAGNGYTGRAGAEEKKPESRAGTQAGAEEKSPVGQAGVAEKGRKNRAGGRALRAAAVLAALALLGASPAPEGRERISRGEVLARAPGRLVEQGEDRLCFEEGKGRYTLYFFDGQGRLCRLARLEPGRAPCAPGPSGVQ